MNRKDLFLMMGTLENVNTENMVWGTLPKNYNQDYKVSLKALDAKVKFKVSANAASTYRASANTPRSRFRPSHSDMFFGFLLKKCSSKRFGEGSTSSLFSARRSPGSL